jgi:hypothetical protein
LFKLGNVICRGTGILPVFFGHGQHARATEIGKLIGPAPAITLEEMRFRHAAG